MRTLKYLYCFSPTMVALTLLMIVKDEAENLRRGLPTIIPHISSYCIGVDKATTDDTQKVLDELLEGIPGVTFDSPWNNSFADARNQVIMFAQGIAPEVSTHGIWMDADHTFGLDTNFKDLEKVLGDAGPVGNVTIRSGSFNHQLPWVIAREDGKFDFEWKGVLHEFQSYKGKSRVLNTSLPITLRHYYDGNARQKGVELYERDAKMLMDALVTENDEFLLTRYVFYLANSYKDAADKDNAIRWYKMRTMLGKWDQEIYESWLSIARFTEDLEMFKKAIEVCPTRPDAYEAALFMARDKENHRWMRQIIDVYESHFGTPTETLPFTNQGGLFVDDDKLWKVDDELSMAYYWAKEDKDLAMLHSKRALELCDSPVSRKRITANQSFFN